MVCVVDVSGRAGGWPGAGGGQGGGGLQEAAVRPPAAQHRVQGAPRPRPQPQREHTQVRSRY